MLVTSTVEICIQLYDASVSAAAETLMGILKRVIVTPVVYSRFAEFIHVGIQNTVTTVVTTKEYLSRVAARVETDGPAGYEQRNLGQICHALVCRRIERAGSTMPLISLEFSDTES